MFFNHNISNELIKRIIRGIYRKEVDRLFPNLKFECAIHFTGYERGIMNLFSEMDAKKIIYTHNDLVRERKTKNNIHILSLKKAYSIFDKIVIIRSTMREEIKKLVKGVDDKKIVVAHNFNDIKRIKKLSLCEVCYDDDTYSNISLKKLKSILDDSNITKFIDIARYSYEKGLDQLIYAFQRHIKNYPDSYLIIVGGEGNDFDKIKSIVNSNEIKKVVMIKSISNPYAILAKCDCFVLSSHYEGLPMTIMEALILDKKVICTSITGPKEFLSNGYGYLVEDSEDGLLEGMKEYADNGLENLVKFDAEEFNRKAVIEYERIIEE